VVCRLTGCFTGRGSYGSVYKALLKATGEFVAIKVIQHGQGDKMADIQKEISMLSECNHPNVVRYIVSRSLRAHFQGQGTRNLWLRLRGEASALCARILATGGRHQRQSAVIDVTG